MKKWPILANIYDKLANIYDRMADIYDKMANILFSKILRTYQKYI